MKYILTLAILFIARIYISWNEPYLTNKFSIFDAKNDSVMKQVIDLTGQRFGRLAVVAQHGFRIKPSGQRRMWWRCVCDCGKETITDGFYLRNGDTKSCGCYNLDNIKAMHLKHGHTVIRGMTREYVSWQGMRNRCHNPNDLMYHAYGAKGIIVCERWRNSFENFLADMGPRPNGKTLDRKENSGNYEPINCRWATAREQAANKSTNRWIEYDGKRLIAAEWARQLNISPTILHTRLKSWSFDKIYDYYTNRKRKI